jgi:hypothetical protein
MVVGDQIMIEAGINMGAAERRFVVVEDLALRQRSVPPPTAVWRQDKMPWRSSR